MSDHPSKPQPAGGRAPRSGGAGRRSGESETHAPGVKKAEPPPRYSSARIRVPESGNPGEGH